MITTQRIKCGKCLDVQEIQVDWPIHTGYLQDAVNKAAQSSGWRISPRAECPKCRREAEKTEKTLQYHLVEADKAEVLSRAVTGYLNRGWKLHGDPVTAVTGRLVRLYQAVTYTNKEVGDED